MPFDQKRINGPESSFSYKQFVEVEDNVKSSDLKKKRADGRKFDESRKLGEFVNDSWFLQLKFIFSQRYNSMQSQKPKDLVILRTETRKFSALFLSCAKFQE